jgi:hypothetical protein
MAKTGCAKHYLPVTQLNPVLHPVRFFASKAVKNL